MRVRVDAEPGEIRAKLVSMVKALLTQDGADADLISRVEVALCKATEPRAASGSASADEHPDEPVTSTAELDAARVVKGRHFVDEDVAQRAHGAVREQYPDVEEGSERYWRLKTRIYRKMGGSFGKLAKGLFAWDVRGHDGA